MTTLADLLTLRTAAQLRDAALARLAALGFPVTSWASGGVARTLVEAFGWMLEDNDAARAAIARGGLLDLAEGPWLTLLAKSLFDVDRQLADFATGLVTLAETAGAGPYTITSGSFVVGRNAAGAAPARRYVAVTAGTLNPNGTLPVRVKAEQPGAAYNLGASQVTFLFTPLPGVTCTNASDWLSQANCQSGVDEESDARLRQRCRDRWSTLGRGATRAAYRYWITSASAEVTKVYFAPPPGNGAVPVYVAGDAAAVSGGALTAVQSSVEAQKPLTDTPTVANANPLPLNVTGFVTVKAADLAAAQVAADDARAAFQKALDIGGLVDLGALYQILRAHPSALDADITSPTGDTTIPAPAFGVLDLSGVVWTGVS